MATFDKNCIKEFITRVEDDTAEFIGAEFCAARLIGFIHRQYELGELSKERALELLGDATHLGHLAKLGHRYAKMVRKPTPEMEIMVLADQKVRAA